MPDVTERSVTGGVSSAFGAQAVEAAEMSTSTDVALGIEAQGMSPGRLALRRFLRHKLAMGSALVLLIITLATLLAPVLTHHGYADIPTPAFKFRLLGPGAAGGLFGTDGIGRDMLARVLYGGRVSLAVGMGVAVLSTIIGTVVGAISGFFGRGLDLILMRITDFFLAMPLLIILIIMSKVFGGSILDIVLILSLFFWMPIARIVRGLFLSAREKEFVEAARALGASNRRIMFRHILPNTLGPIIVSATLIVASAILTESVLSFLGFGVQQPVPTWGNLLEDGRQFTTIAPWLVWFPGLFILITVLAVNFLGDGLRDALDPTQRRVRA